MVAKTLISGGQEVPYFDLNDDYTVYMPCPPPKSQLFKIWQRTFQAKERANAKTLRQQSSLLCSGDSQAEHSGAGVGVLDEVGRACEAWRRRLPFILRAPGS